MPLSIVQFFDRLRECGVLPPGEAVSWLKKIPPEKRGQDAQPVVSKLVEAKKLTSYQAEAICAGNQASLVLGDYVILSKIGEGGMGQVFEARHRRMKRVVALKVLPSAMTNEAESIKRFEREVEAAARLSHPNIVQAHDAGEQKGIHYLVMEYVEGGDLANLVRLQGPLPCEQAVSYMLQAARGLAHAHAQGIVHRDIKPANLLLDSHGTVKILDMGLARFERKADEDSDGLTQAGTLMGTVDFMSPEQALDTKTADARADVYSLGCTLYYLLTGRRLYDGDTIMKRLVAHRDAPIPSLSAAPVAVPPAVAEIFERMVAKKPADRFQTMEQVCATLHAAVPDLVPAGTPGAPPPVIDTAAEPVAPPLAAENTVALAESRTQKEARPTLPVVPSQGAYLAVFAGAGFIALSVGLVALIVLATGTYLVWQSIKSRTPGTEQPPEMVAQAPTASEAKATLGVSVPTTDDKSAEAKPKLQGAPALAAKSLGVARVRRGQMETLKVSVDRTNCVGPVVLKLSGLPDKVSCANETILASQDSVNLKFYAEVDAPLSESTVTIAASLGELETTGICKLSVDRAPGLRVLPLADQTLKPGGKVSPIVNFARDGYDGPVRVTTTGVPDSFKVLSADITISAGFYFPLEISAPESAAPKTYTVRVSATGGIYSAWQEFRLTVESGTSAATKPALPTKPTAPSTRTVLFEHDAKKKVLLERDDENTHSRYEDGSYVLEVGRGKERYVRRILKNEAADFEAEFRCKLIGSSKKIEMTIGFPGNAESVAKTSRYDWSLNRAEQHGLAHTVDIGKRRRVFVDVFTPELKGDNWNSLRVKSQRGMLELWINGKRVHQEAAHYSGNSPRTRSISITLSKDGEKEFGRLEFSEIKITRLGSP